MVFNSLAFLIFFGLFYLGWLGVKKRTKLRLFYIVAASAFFYGWLDWRFLFLVFISGIIDYVAALLMERSTEIGTRRCLLFFSMLGNLGMLFVFKYSKFIAESISGFLSIFHLEVNLVTHIPEMCLFIPAGISFYTFQSMSYTIDVYRRELKPTHSMIHFFAYLMLFPQLVAGPIVRASDLLYKLLLPPCSSPMTRYNGLKLVLLGFFKKCFIADNVNYYINLKFANINQDASSTTWWIVMILFAIQIYCDFSGYTDIARGIIKIMGYRFNQNFNHPYFSDSFKDFWGRWHISLSSWFRDYVYIPLGGSRHPVYPVEYGMRNLFITFVLSGIWHGAGWNFLFWGMLHGIYLIVERLTKLPERLKKLPGGRYISMLIVFFFVLLAWVFFRAESLGKAFNVVFKMLSFSFTAVWDYSTLLYIGIFVFMELALFNRWDIKLLRHMPYYRNYLEPLGLAGMTAATIIFRGAGDVFIYFNF
ncbi:MAG: MBOAT family protein [Lentisphaeria bacterium]|nr:MBOAT family protein [Lentisphaeria bacterium]